MLARPGLRTVAAYGFALAIAALALQWLEYRWLARTASTELYVVLVAILFTAIGGWAGSRLVAAPRAPGFERNERALASLGISAREFDVLELLAEGLANKEIARRLAVSPNTIKTHVARLYDKLEVSRRTQAIARARELCLLP